MKTKIRQIAAPVIAVGVLGAITVGAAATSAQAAGNPNIRDNSVTTSDIRNESILHWDIAAGAVRGSEIANNSITLADINDTTEKSLRGQKGATGARGPQGAKGATGARGPQGAKGATGAQGKQGVPGPQGKQGPEGRSAYDIAVAAGFKGTEQEWLASLEGAEGAQGPAGVSDYTVITKYTRNSGTELGYAVPAGATAQWIALCPEGTFALGGGVSNGNTKPGTDLVINESLPHIDFKTNTATGWSATVTNPTGVAQHGQVSVVCAAVN